MGVHFVIPREFESRLANLRRCRLGVDFPYWLGGSFNWPAQSWLVLREYREELSIGVAPIAGRVNFAHVQTWRALGPRRGEFRVSVRADYPQLFDVDFEVVQNPVVRMGKRRSYLPYWPVPGVIGRHPSRKGVRTVAYAGRLGTRNLVAQLRDAQMLAYAGVGFRVIPADRWHDMSEVDALVAIRSFDRKPHHTKPPHKLFHAWRAGVPLVAGWDSAYSAVGHPGRDYVRVESMKELRAALLRLVEDSAVYDAFVREGRRRAPEVSHEAIAQLWLERLDGAVAEAFASWQESPPNRLISGLLRAVDQMRRTATLAKARATRRRRESAQ